VSLSTTHKRSFSDVESIYSLYVTAHILGSKYIYNKLGALLGFCLVFFKILFILFIFVGNFCKKFGGNFFGTFQNLFNKSPKNSNDFFLLIASFYRNLRTVSGAREWAKTSSPTNLTLSIKFFVSLRGLSLH